MSGRTGAHNVISIRGYICQIRILSRDVYSVTNGNYAKALSRHLSMSPRALHGQPYFEAVQPE